MRRRRNNGAPVTFFSFQDVMLSLIGITIVITLILVLQVTDSAVAVLKRTGGAAGRAVTGRAAPGPVKPQRRMAAAAPPLASRGS